MKDLPTVLPAGFAIAAVLPRGDVRDAFISANGKSLSRLAIGRGGRQLVASTPGSGEAAKAGP